MDGFYVAKFKKVKDGIIKTIDEIKEEEEINRNKKVFKNFKKSEK